MAFLIHSCFSSLNCNALIEVNIKLILKKIFKKMYFSFTVMANLQDFWDKVNSLMSFGLPLPTVLAFPSIPFALFDQTLYKKTQFWRQIYFPITFNFKMVWIKADGIYIIQQ